jgi:hypothetical protein
LAKCDVAPADGQRRGAAETDNRQHAGNDQALVERAHDRAVGPSLTKKVPMIDVMIDAPQIASG